jgi:2-dehydropantoate 2-reductase
VKIAILGAGAQGTLYGVRLARAGHDVKLVARGQRSAELRSQGAVVEDALSRRTETVNLPVLDALAPDTQADLCFITVRREQMMEVLPACAAVRDIKRFVFMVNHANGSDALIGALGREKVVLGFPGAAGGIENGVDYYVEVAEQATAIEAIATDVAAVLKGAGFRVELVGDMDSWLKRHAVFVTAICGGIYQAGGNAQRLSSDAALVREIILGIREGWAALDAGGVAAAPLPLRAIFCWMPLPFAVKYWQRLFGSERGEHYFARHARHAALEMAALAADVRAITGNSAMPHLRVLYAAIDRAAG